MKAQPWSEDARFPVKRRRRRSAMPEAAPERSRAPREAAVPRTPSADPFEIMPADRSHTLEPGWLLEGATRATEAKTASSPHEARSWRQRAAALGGRLRDVERRTTARLWRPRYPLAGTRYVAGLSLDDRLRLERAFRDATAPRHWRSRRAAVEHLESLAPRWPVRELRDMRGVHVFLGAAGSGKSTLVLKAARQLRAAGRHVGVIALFPGSPERMTAFRAAARRLDVPACFAQREEELDEAVHSLAGCGTLLVDTPCLISRPARSRQMARLRLLRHPSTVLHYSLCLHHARAFQRRELAAAAAHEVDFLALSHVDLAPGAGVLFALQLHRPRRISLANAHADLEEPLLPFGTTALLHALQIARPD